MISTNLLTRATQKKANEMIASFNTCNLKSLFNWIWFKWIHWFELIWFELYLCSNGIAGKDVQHAKNRSVRKISETLTDGVSQVRCPRIVHHAKSQAAFRVVLHIPQLQSRSMPLAQVNPTIARNEIARRRCERPEDGRLAHGACPRGEWDEGKWRWWIFYRMPTGQRV